MQIMESRYGRRWNREELIIAFNYYCQTPFGRLHKSNPEIIDLASLLRRTPDALAMKLVNFASLDPHHKSRGVKGLGHAGPMAESVFEEFQTNWSELAIESQVAREKLVVRASETSTDTEITEPKDGKTEDTRMARVRLVQSFFRRTVLAVYGSDCAICRISLPEVIIASHIIPWSVDERRRADPTNGLALCAFHDKVFDRGLISFDKSFRVMLSERVRTPSDSEMHKVGLLEIEGRELHMPDRFQPDDNAVRYHRENIFSY